MNWLIGRTGRRCFSKTYLLLLQIFIQRKLVLKCLGGALGPSLSLHHNSQIKKLLLLASTQSKEIEMQNSVKTNSNTK